MASLPRSPGRLLLSRVCHDLGLDTDLVPSAHASVPLRSRLATGELAWASVSAVAAAAGIRTPIDPERIAVAYRSDRVLTVDEVAPPVWSPYSGFWRTADGWVRTHGNYPHHAAALVSAVGAGADPEAMRDAFLALRTSDAVSAVTAAGGLAVPVVREDPRRDGDLRRSPLLGIERFDDRPPSLSPARARGTATRDARRLDGIRVLDLTRVIAGPVCTRTLALLGADVLRLDPPHLPEPGWQHLDTGHGKRTALLDARSAAVHDLLDRADVVVLGYRPAAMERLGLSAHRIAERHPGIVIAQLSAWGLDHPERAGFDSLVQAESGIALIESPDGERPGALPAQALDHSAGYLLAAAVVTLLAQRRETGRGAWAHTSLRRVAAELLGMPRLAEPGDEAEIDVSAHTARFSVGGQTLRTVRPALPGLEFAAPHPWGSDHPGW